MIEVDCGKLLHTQTQTGRHTHTQVEKEREVRGGCRHKDGGGRGEVRKDKRVSERDN